MSLPEELVLLRLHEARQRGENLNLKNSTDDNDRSWVERRHAVRDAKYLLGSYGASYGVGGRLAWDHAEPIRIACDEEALRVRFESREQDAKQRARIQAVRERVRQRVASSGLDLSLSDGSRHSKVLHELQNVKRGSVMLRMVADAKRSVGNDSRGIQEDQGRVKVRKQQLQQGAADRCGGLRGDGEERAEQPRVMPRAPIRAQLQHERTGVNVKTNQIGGFGSAKTEYIQVMKKQGKKADFGGQTGRQPGLRGQQKQNQPNIGMDIESQKHLPPYMRKALASMNSLGKNSNAGVGGQKKRPGGSGSGSAEDQDGPISIRTYELLGLDPEDELPDELSRIDPRMIEQVCNEVIDSSASVAWEDIAGQDAAKRLIQEVVVWPMMNPDIFKGARAPPKGILLFGPPGTGKTLLGKAIASNIDASFFAISASSLTSKWIGDGEKMVKALFAVAGWMAPSVIFIDEIDSLLSARKSEGEHESSRRLKTEILVQMEGCDPASAERKVLLVGATNRPEELDEAARRRMPKQMYIPLPCEKAREEMIHRVLTQGSIASQLSAEDVAKVVAKTEGYSGSDMKNLIQEACQGPIREAVRRAGAAVATLKEQDLRPVVLKDFAVASKAQRASTEPCEIVRYEEYNDKHGAKIVEDCDEGAGEDDVSEGW